MSMLIQPGRFAAAAGPTDPDFSSVVLLLGGSTTTTWQRAALQKSLPNNSTGWSGSTLRQVVQTTGLSVAGGSKVRVSFTAGTGGFIMSKAYIGAASTTGDAYDFETTPSQLLFSGVANVTAGASATIVTDELVYAIDITKPLLITAHFSGTSSAVANNVGDYAAYFKLTTDEAASVDVSGYTTGGSTLYFVSNVESYAPSILDESGSAKATVMRGNTFADTAQFKFGTTSIKFDGDRDGLVLADSADWQLGTSNSSLWTIELWARFASVAATTTMIAQNDGSGSTRAWALDQAGTSLQFLQSPDGVNWNTVTTSGVTLAVNTWYHIAVDHDAAGKIRVYVDGVMRGSSTPANSAIFDSPAALVIGMHFTAIQSVNGWMDELRITKGAARYASDGGFTVPTAAFPRA